MTLVAVIFCGTRRRQKKCQKNAGNEISHRTIFKIHLRFTQGVKFEKIIRRNVLVKENEQKNYDFLFGRSK